jgi:hypothetical protein
MQLLNVNHTLNFWTGETPEGKRIAIQYLCTDRDKLKVAVEGKQQIIYLDGEYAGVFCTADLAQCGFTVRSWQGAAREL